MKKSIFIAIFACFASQIFAQSWNGSNNDEILFSRSRRVGFFVSPITEFSDFKHDLTTASGGGINNGEGLEERVHDVDNQQEERGG